MTSPAETAVAKSRRGVPAYTLFVNRPLGRFVAAAAFRAGVTPNQVTAVSGLLSLGGIAVVALVRPSMGAGLAAAALLATGYVLDSADGQLARLRGGGGPAGEWFDHVVDSARMVALHGSVLVSAYRFSTDPPSWHLALPLAFQLVAVVLFFATVLAEQLLRGRAGGDGPGPRSSDGSSAGSTLRSVLMLPVDFGVVCLSFASLGWPGLFWPVYAGLFTAAAGFLLAALRQSYRRLSA